MTAEQTEQTEQIARAFHEAYVRLAPAFADVPTVPAVPWAGISAPDRALMAAVVQDLTDSGVIHPGALPGGGPSDEDRIRDAMTEALDHPRRTITR